MKKIQILVVEDEAIVAEDMSVKLNALGYTVCGSASTGESALKKVNTCQPDIILMDIRLRDDIDGIETTKKIQEQYDIPVIYMTAYNDKRTLNRMKKTLPYGFIMKPVDDRELEGVIEATLFKHDLETKLHESEEKYRVLFESAGDAILVMQDLIFVDCNRKALELFACRKSQIIGKTPLDFSPHLQPDGQPSKEKVMTMWKAAQKKGGQSFEWQHLRDDGTSIDVEVKVNKLPLNGETFLVSFIRDITDRKKVESALEQEKQFLDGIIEGLPGLFYMIDDQGTIIRWNKNREKILGYTSEELQDSYFLNNIAKEDRDRIAGELKAIYQKGFIQSEFAIVDKQSNRIPFSTNAVKIKIGNNNYVVGLAIDISDRKKIEERLNEQLQFEKLITMLSADFINLPANKVDIEIKKALKSISVFFGAGRSAIIQPTVDEKNFEITHFYCKTGLESIPLSLDFTKQFSYVFKRPLMDQFVQFSSLDELPEEAKMMKQYYKMQGIKSFIALPLAVGGSVIGALSIAFFDKERTWDPNIIKRLRLLGQIFANALIRKKSEELLRENEERFRSVVEKSYDGIILTDELGHIIEWNKAVEKKSKIKRSQALGQPFWDIIIQAQPSAYRSVFSQKQLKATILEACRTGKVPWFGKVREQEMVLSDNNRLVVQSITYPIKTQKGYRIGIISRDITQQKLADQALRENEKQLSLIVNNVAEAIALIKVEKDGAFRFVQVNPKLLDLDNIEKSEILNKRLEDVFPADVAKYRYNKYREVVQSKSRVFFEREDNIHYGKGGTIFLETTLIPIFNEHGECTHILSINQDVTDSKKAREAERKSQRAYQLASLGTLAAGIAHEINQPLTALMIKTDSLLYWGEEEESLNKQNIISHLRFISNEADKINQIIKHMRSMVRREKTHLESVNIDELIQRATSLVGQQLKSHGIQLILNFQKKMPPVSASKIPMERVVVNLISNSMNALDRVQKEDKWIKIKTRTFRDKGIIEVQDNGPGIPDEMIDYIFDPLLTTEEDGKGMGLGLAIANYLIEDIGGSIQARTPDEGGALFKISLPLI